MPAFNKFEHFTHKLGQGIINLSTNTLKIAFSNTAPVATNTKLVDITQITTAGGYVAGGFALDTKTWTTSAGTAKLVADDEVFTATATTDPFRYIVLYEDTTVDKWLIGWYDYGSSIQLVNGQSFTTDFDQTAGILTLA